MEFMSRNDNSRQNPEKKEKLKFKGKTHQTRTLNDYLKNLHRKYIGENPDVKLSFASFCRIRPNYIKLTSFTAWSSCLCTKHQHVAVCLKALKSSGLDIPFNPETVIKEESHMGAVRMNMTGKLKYSQWKRVTVGDKGRTAEQGW
ncbi:hypothetical protein DPMN_038630 [Dreissena polymorpha]|uniref:Uncharacterized protein n=1 Tax=Dreissena polymorpha TaxID=45954 RepID=A0A9D4MHD1_DREPO|nr:hypothetical protein DPMN_038630 [Dreissena polymorpha]